jgi:hypothetical protein
MSLKSDGDGFSLEEEIIWRNFGAFRWQPVGMGQISLFLEQGVDAWMPL